MTFAHPHILWLLLVVPPLLVVFFWWSMRERRRLMAQFIEARLLPGLISGVSRTRQKIRIASLIGGVALAIIALARPQWGFTWEEEKQKGLDIVVAIDTSKSMLAEDIAPNRLARAKLAALDLMQQAKSDRLGLIAFAGGAFLQCPMTIDDNAFRQSVEALDVNIIPQGGTALAESINTALKAFKEDDNFKILVLFTDGEDNDEGALAAAEAAAKKGMKIFTIGIGTAEGELLRVRDAKGRTDYIRDAQGNVVKSRLNETLLQQIAGATDGGFYLPLRGAKTIDTLYEKGLAPLPKTVGQEKLVKRYHERYHWPLAVAIALLLLEMLLPERKREKRAVKVRRRRLGPSATSEAGTPNVGVPAATAILALLLWPGVATASPSAALREYNAGKFDKALAEYQHSLEKKKDDPRLQFNAGTAAYRNRKFDEATKHFSDALAAPDLKLQEHAYYNLGNTLYREGEALPDPQKQKQSWESAVNQYESALKLNTNNADAKFNRDFVKERLEELKQQQQQQQKQDQNKDQQDKQQQKDQQQKQNEKQDQQSQQQQAQNDQQKQDEKKQQSQADKQGQEKKDEQQAKSSADQSKEQPQEKQEGEQQQLAAHAMTPQEAQQLLDAQKGDEKVLQFVPQGERRNRERTLKDW